MTDLATSGYPLPLAQRSPILQLWNRMHRSVRMFAGHSDPLAEASNWGALTVGSHLPFWPLYIFWVAGREAMPSSLLTAAMAPVFLIVPMIARRSSLMGRIATPLFGITNTVFTIWALGANSGTEVFLVPCAALAAFTFRRTERLLMLGLSMLPLVVWYLLQEHPLPTLHQYDATVARDLVVLNVSSIGVLIGLFGWFQADIYGRMEAPISATRK